MIKAIKHSGYTGMSLKIVYAILQLTFGRVITYKIVVFWFFTRVFSKHKNARFFMFHGFNKANKCLILDKIGYLSMRWGGLSTRF